ncbi:MAG: hypothetical protein IJ317_04475 [Clostridia bacterium]|nr:hypothetical protein [Clostridia bacterium]
MKKFKFFAILAVVCVTVAAVVGGTLAYFTDSQEMTSVFTSGNVYIELTEAAVKADDRGNLVADTEKDRLSGGALNSPTVNDYGVLFPGQSVYKDPTVKNVGTSDAWVAMKMIVTDGAGDIHNALGYSGNDSIDVKALLSGGLLSEAQTVQTWNGISGVHVSENYAFLQVPNRAEGRYEFYFFMQKELATNETVTLFDTLKIDETCTNELMKEFVEFKITIQAFAVQTFGFESCFEAMNGAFGSHFADVAKLVPTV